MKYRHIKEHTGQYTVRFMCRALEVSPQGYYQWQNGAERRQKREQEDRRLLDRILTIHAESRRTYGRIRVTRELQAQGQEVNEKRVGRLMRAGKIRAKAARKFKATTDSKHSRPIAPNILARDFTAASPNQKWVGDITCVWTEEGWLYLAVVLDLFSRKVVGWSISHRMQSELVCTAL